MFVTGDPEKDFFVQNPELRYFPCIMEFVKSAGEDTASRIMWAIYLTEDVESRYFSLSRDERRKIIAEGYLKDRNFDWDRYEDLVKCYITISMTQMTRWYKTLYEQFDNMVMEAAKGDLSSDKDYSKLITLFEKLERMLKGMETIRSKADKEKTSDEARGTQPGWIGKKISK